jgi:general secretion pathway protein L
LTEALLLFLGAEDGFAGWLRLEGGAVAARGRELDGLPDPAGAATLVAVVPGEQVALHWLDLPSGLAPAQAAAAARLMVGEASAQPMAEMHVAVGRETAASPQRCVALVPAAAMDAWLARLAAHGVDPHLVIPETLLLPEPAEGLVRHDRGPVSLYRGVAEAFAAEPDVGDMVAGARPVTRLGDEAFEAGLAAAIDAPLLDLRQGPFARRRRLHVERARLRRLALLAAGLAAITLAVQIAAITRYTFAADSLEAEAKRVAAAALPRSPGVTDASGDLGRRLAELRGGGVGYGAIAGALFAAVRATPNVEISRLGFTPDGHLRAVVHGDGPAALAALAERVEAGGFAVERGPPRSGGGRQVQDFMVRPR